MANTTNLNMVKPAGTDHALISVINSNMDIIDGAVGALPSGSTLQGEIDSANTAIGNIATSADIGTFSTQSGLDSALDTVLSNTVSNGVKSFQFSTSAAFGIFDNGATYLCTLYKSGTNTTFSHANFRTVSSVKEITGRRTGTGWTYAEISMDIYAFEEKQESNGISIAAGANGTQNITVTKSGYTPVMAMLISPWNEHLALGGITITDANTVACMLINTSSGAVTARPRLKVMYVKS